MTSHVSPKFESRRKKKKKFNGKNFQSLGFPVCIEIQKQIFSFENLINRQYYVIYLVYLWITFVPEWSFESSRGHITHNLTDFTTSKERGNF